MICALLKTPQHSSHFLFMVLCIPIMGICCVIMPLETQLVMDQKMLEWQFFFYTDLFLFSIFVVHIRQNKVNPSHSIPEEHCVFVWL